MSFASNTRLALVEAICDSSPSIMCQNFMVQTIMLKNVPEEDIRAEIVSDALTIIDKWSECNTSSYDALCNKFLGGASKWAVVSYYKESKQKPIEYWELLMEYECGEDKLNILVSWKEPI